MKKKRQNKLVSLITAGLLIVNQIGVMPALWALPPSEVRIPSPGFQLNLPPDLGTVQTIHSGSGPTLIHIQTAHGNYEAQKKIQAILHYLKDTYGFKLLLLEGSASKLNPELLKFFPQRMDLTMKIAEELTKEALVKGDELFLLEEPKAEAYGIESVEAYRRNREAFKSVLTQQEKTEGFLRDMDVQIERLTGPYLNKDLRTFLKRLDTFEIKGLPLLDWLSYLKGQTKEHLALDLADPVNQIDWPMLLRIYKLKEFESKLDLNAFAKERDQFFTEIAPSLRGAKRRSNLHPGIASASSGTLPRNDYEEIKTLLSSPLSRNQLPDPETGLLFERMVSYLPSKFNYAAYPNLKLFIGHLILQSEMKGERLLEEMNRLTDKISEKLAKTEAEKKILSLLKDYRLLKRLFALELTPEDYEIILSRHPEKPTKVDDEGSLRSFSRPSGSFRMTSQSSLRPSSIIPRFLELNGTGRVKNIEFNHREVIDTLFEKALEFYQGTQERDHWMLENIQARLKEAGQDKAIVITGGFHAGPFEAFFQKEGYNYALIAPKITSTEGREAYLQAALQNSQGPLKKSTMDLPRRMDLPNVQIALGENLQWIDQRIKAIRLKVLKQSKEPVREGPPSVTSPRAEVRNDEKQLQEALGSIGFDLGEMLRVLGPRVDSIWTGKESLEDKERQAFKQSFKRLWLIRDVYEYNLKRYTWLPIDEETKKRHAQTALEKLRFHVPLLKREYEDLNFQTVLQKLLGGDRGLLTKATELEEHLEKAREALARLEVASGTEGETLPLEGSLNMAYLVQHTKSALEWLVSNAPGYSKAYTQGYGTDPSEVSWILRDKVEEVMRFIGDINRKLFIPEPVYEPDVYSPGEMHPDLDSENTDPILIALNLILLNLKGDEKVLEIGTGRGYQAAILARFLSQGHLYTVEQKEAALNKAKTNLSQLGVSNVSFYHRDGQDGYPELARELQGFDAIVVSGAIPYATIHSLKDQLKIGGRLVTGVLKDPANPKNQDFSLFIKTDKGQLLEMPAEEGVDYFVPLKEVTGPRAEGSLLGSEPAERRTEQSVVGRESQVSAMLGFLNDPKVVFWSVIGIFSAIAIGFVIYTMVPLFRRNRNVEYYHYLGFFMRGPARSDEEGLFAPLFYLTRLALRPFARRMFAKAIAHEDSRVRSLAVSYLGQYGNRSSVAPLIEMLSFPRPDERRAAIHALGKLRYREAVPALIKLLSDPDQFTRRGAASVLGEIKDRRAVVPLIEYVNHHGADNVVVRALGALKDRRAVPTLIKVLFEGGFNEERSLAAEYLGDFGDQSAVEPLIRKLESNDDLSVLIRAAKSVGRLGDKRTAISFLLKALPAANDYHLYYDSETALGELGVSQEDMLRAYLNLLRRDNSSNLSFIGEAIKDTGRWIRSLKNKKLRQDLTAALENLTISPTITISEYDPEQGSDTTETRPNPVYEQLQAILYQLHRAEVRGDWLVENLQGGVVLTDQKADLGIKQYPLPHGMRIAVLELEENDSVPFAGNFIETLRHPDKENELQVFKISRDADLQKVFQNFQPDLALAPSDVFADSRWMQNLLQSYVDKRAGPLRVLYHESFLMKHPTNVYFPFSSADLETMKEALGKHQTQLRRTSYVTVLEFLSRAVAMRKNLQKGDDVSVDYANPFILFDIENGDAKPVVRNQPLFSNAVPLIVFSPHPDDLVIAAAGPALAMLHNAVNVEDWVLGIGQRYRHGVQSLTDEEIRWGMTGLKNIFKKGLPFYEAIGRSHDIYQRVLKELKEKPAGNKSAGIIENINRLVEIYGDRERLRQEIDSWDGQEQPSDRVQHLIGRIIRRKELEESAAVLDGGLPGKMTARWFDLESVGYPSELGEVPEDLLAPDKERLKHELNAFFEQHKDAILRDQSQGIPWTIILPHPRDSHSQHRTTTKITLAAIEEISKEKGLRFQILQYLAPWAGGYNTYFLTDRSPSTGAAPEIANRLSAAREFQYALSHLVGELAGGFGAQSPSPEQMGGHYAERFERALLVPVRSEVRGEAPFLARPEIGPERRAVIFGPGRVGRGHLAEIWMRRNGGDIVFVTRNPEDASLINERRFYGVKPTGLQGPMEIGPVTAIHYQDSEKLRSLATHADWIFTAVRTENVLDLTEPLLTLLEARWMSSRREVPVNIIFVENFSLGQRHLNELREKILGRITNPEFRRFVEEKIGFVGAIAYLDVPEQYPGADRPLDLIVEGGRYDLVVDAQAFKGPREELAKLQGFVPVDEIDTHRRRKFLIQNLGHAVLAYLADELRFTELAPAMGESKIRIVVRQAMKESAEGLAVKYPQFRKEELDTHVEELLVRFSDLGLRDTTKRVGRDPLRKLRPTDRLLSAGELAKEAKVNEDPSYQPVAINLGIASAIRYARRHGMMSGEELTEVLAQTRELGLEIPWEDLAFKKAWDELVSSKLQKRVKEIGERLGDRDWRERVLALEDFARLVQANPDLATESNLALVLDRLDDRNLDWDEHVDRDVPEAVLEVLPLFLQANPEAFTEANRGIVLAKLALRDPLFFWDPLVVALSYFRRANPQAFARDIRLTLDVGGTSVRVGLIESDTGGILSERVFPMDKQDRTAIVSQLVDLVRNAFIETLRERRMASQIVIGFPTRFSQIEGQWVILDRRTNLTGDWYGFPFPEEIKRQLKQRGLDLDEMGTSLRVISDDQAAAEGELHPEGTVAKKGLTEKKILAVTLGTGIGGILIKEDQVYLPNPYVGWVEELTPLRQELPALVKEIVGDKSKRKFLNLATGTALAEWAKAYAKHKWERDQELYFGDSPEGLEEITGRSVSRALIGGREEEKKVAQELLQGIGRNLALGVVSLVRGELTGWERVERYPVDILEKNAEEFRDVEAVIFGGGLAEGRSGEIIEAVANETLAQAGYPHIRVYRSALEGRAGILGGVAEASRSRAEVRTSSVPEEPSPTTEQMRAQVERVLTQIIEDLDNGRTVMFVGAGISFNSGVPIVSDFERLVMTELGVSEKEFETLRNSNLPFESFMETLIDFSGSKERRDQLLDAFGYGKPNNNHRLIAKLAKSGKLKTIVTTNFDTLIEQALQKEHQDYEVLSNEEQFDGINWDEDKVRVIKIHGSIEDKDNLIVTLKKVAGRGSSESSRNVIKHIYAEGGHQNVLVLGYSSSDVFDISPQIESLTEGQKNVFYIKHRHRGKRRVKDVTAQKEQNPFGGFPGKRVFINTDRFIERVWRELLLEKGKGPREKSPNKDRYRREKLQETPWREDVKDWIQATDEVDKLTEVDKPTIVGNLFSKISENKIAEKYYKQALKVAIAAENKPWEGSALVNLGNASHGLGRYREAIEYYIRALEIARDKDVNDKEMEGDALNGLGNVYRSYGQYPEALNSYERALKIAIDAKEKAMQGTIHQNVGNLSYDLAQYYPEAIHSYFQALEIARDKDVNDKEMEGTALNGLGTVYQHLDLRQHPVLKKEEIKIKIAINYHNQALEIFKQIGHREGQGKTQTNLGNAYQHANQFQQALEHYNQALEIQDEDKEGRVITLDQMGNAYGKQGDHENAIKYHEKALKIAKGTNKGRVLINLGADYTNLGKLREAIGFYGRALKILKRYLREDHPDTKLAASGLSRVKRELSELEASKHPSKKDTGSNDESGSESRAEVRREVSQDSAVGNFLTPRVRNLLSLRSGIFPLTWFSQYGKGFLSSVLTLALGDRTAQAALESEKERFDRAKSLFGPAPKVSHAYIFGPEFALDDGGLAFVRTVFGDSPAVVIVRNPKEETFLQEYNQKLMEKNRPAILVAHDIREARAKLRDWIHQIGGVKPGAFTPWGVVKSTEPLAVPLKQALRDNLTIVTTDLFNRFTEISGLEALVSQLRSQFQFAKSA